jgi:large subunit ribosomal protein L21e
MAMRMGGFRRKTRKKLSKEQKNKGKIGVKRYFQEFKQGDYAAIRIEPSVKEGMPRPDFQGKTGKIVGKQGKCYFLLINDLGKLKRVLVHPVHLVRVKK